MEFALPDIQELIEECLLQNPTGDEFLDARYREQIGIIGHTNPYYRLFYLIARKFKPGLTVELGTWQGTGSAHFAAGNPYGNVVAIDIHKDDKDAQRRTIEAAVRYENMLYINEWTWDAIGKIKDNASFGPIDILFIDAWHDYQYAKREWDLYSPLLNSPALVICDDITPAHNFDRMEQFWDELPGEKFLNSQVHYPIPMGFMRYVGPDREANQVIQPATKKRVGRPKRQP